MIREYWYRAELMIRQSVVVFRQDKVKTRRWRLPPVVRAYARLRQGRAAAERSAAKKAYSHSGKGSAPRERERELQTSTATLMLHFQPDCIMLRGEDVRP
jgi:hypothetical protein